MCSVAIHVSSFVQFLLDSSACHHGLMQYIAKPSSNEKPLAPAIENATSRQFSVVTPFRDCFSCRVMSPKDMSLPAVAHIQVVEVLISEWYRNIKAWSSWPNSCTNSVPTPKDQSSSRATYKVSQGCYWAASLLNPFLCPIMLHCHSFHKSWY